MTDLKKLLDDSSPFDKGVRHFVSEDDLLDGPSNSALSALMASLDSREALRKTMSAQVMGTDPGYVGSIAEKIQQSALPFTHLQKMATEQLEEAAGEHLKRHTSALAWTPPEEGAAYFGNSVHPQLNAVSHSQKSFQDFMDQDAQGIASVHGSSFEKFVAETTASNLHHMPDPADVVTQSYADRSTALAWSNQAQDSVAAMQTFKDEMRQSIVGSPYLANTVAEHLRSEKMVSDDPLRSAYGLSSVTEENLSDFRLADPEKTPTFFEGRTLIDNPAQDYFARERKEMRKRENAKIEYARRSADASEASVAALKAALVAEEKRTADALEEAAAAKKEARRARSNTRIALWFAGASMLLTAWSFIKDQF